MDEENYLRQQLALLHAEYSKAAKPIIDRLVAIECCKQPKPIIFDLSTKQIDLALIGGIGFSNEEPDCDGGSRAGWENEP